MSSLTVAPPINIAMGLTRQVCGLSDPFCDHALGSKFPDNAGIRTLAYPWHARYTLTTDAEGNGAQLFVPQYEYAFPALGTVATGASSVTFSTFTADTKLKGTDQYRINSLGIRLKRICAPLSSSGVIHIRGFSSHNGASLASINPKTYNCDFSADIPLQDCKDIVIVGKRTDIRSKQFHRGPTSTPSINVADWVSPGWGSILVTVVGGPLSVAALDMEIRINYEVTFFDSEASQLLATPAPRSNLSVETVVDRISSDARTVFTNGLKEASGWVASQANQGLRDLLRGRLSAQSALALVVD